MCDSYSHNVNMKEYFHYELENYLAIAINEETLDYEYADGIREYFHMRIIELANEIREQEKIMKKGKNES